MSLKDKGQGSEPLASLIHRAVAVRDARESDRTPGPGSLLRHAGDVAGTAEGAQSSAEGAATKSSLICPETHVHFALSLHALFTPTRACARTHRSAHVHKPRHTRTHTHVDTPVPAHVHALTHTCAHIPTFAGARVCFHATRAPPHMRPGPRPNSTLPQGRDRAGGLHRPRSRREGRCALAWRPCAPSRETC